jgi:hypothetical protein
MTKGKKNVPHCRSNSLCALGWLAFLILWHDGAKVVAHQSIRYWKGEKGDYNYGAVARKYFLASKQIKYTAGKPDVESDGIQFGT